MLKKTILAALCALPIAASAASFSDEARVVRVQEVFVQENQPVERCYTEQTAGAPRDESTSIGGAALGAIAGGILGNQVGGGSGKKIATGVGVIAGAMAGEHIGRNTREGGAGPQQARRCYVEDNWVRTSSGFDVTYEYGGRQLTERMASHPGTRVPVTVSVSTGQGAPVPLR